MKRALKKVLQSNAFFYKIFQKLTRKRTCVSKNNRICNQGFGWFKKDIIGQDNIVDIQSNTLLKGTVFHIRGNHNRITFGENCVVGPKCSFWAEGNNITIHIDSNTTFTHTVHFCAQEDGVSIRVGKDCMFSNNVIVRTSDSHPIYDLHTNQRINPPKDVVIGSHVWIAPNSKIMKGAAIGDGAIIGSDTMVSKSVPENSLAVGHPAKVVKTDIRWTRENLF